MTGATRSTRRHRLVVDGAHLPEPSAVRVIVWDGATIVWLGADPDAAPPADETITLPGAWVTPGFVDAHVHGTATGLMLDGVDLTRADSVDEVTALVSAFARRRDDDPVIGSGWDDHRWPTPGPPSATALAEVAPGRRVLLDRVDGHSCVVDPVTLAEVGDGDGVDRDARGAPTGWLREEAASRARARIWARLSAARLERARHAATAHAAGLGITSMHEMGTPLLSNVGDAESWATGGWPVEVIVWWADLDPTTALSRGLRPGGDLFLDGAIGSRTAAVSGGYRDGPSLGGLFHADDEVVEFFVACTRARVGGGVHAIGDEAIEQAIAAIEQAAVHVGAAAVRACRHRIEHVELPRPDHPRRMAALGVVASAQPAFDALWGGPDGLYATRFGRDRALASNPFRAFAAAGCPMAISSDSPVTPMAPWRGVAAAAAHRGGSSLDTSRALAVATTGGRHVAGQDDVGPLRTGHRADLAVWDGNPLAGDLTTPPRCLATVVAGVMTSS